LEASVAQPQSQSRLQDIFKDAATDAGPFQEFHEALVAKGVRPEMDRLTLARLRGTKLLP
jgi:hypothetical protein